MSKITLLGNSPLERAQVDQWLEYIQRELGSHFKHGMSTKGALEVGSDQMEPGIWFLYPVVQIFTINSFLFTEVATLCMSEIDAHTGTCILQLIGECFLGIKHFYSILDNFKVVSTFLVYI